MQLLTRIGTGLGALATAAALIAVTPCGAPAPGPAAAPLAGHQMFASASGAVRPVAAATVSISNDAFNPANTTVPAGSTVTWTNNDAVAHDVTGGPLHSPTLNQGQSWSYTFSAAGTYDYICSIHPFMHGSVTVT